MALEFTFDPITQRYRYKDSGKFVGKEAIRNLTQKAINQVTQDINVIADLLIQRKITIATWEETTAKALKNLYTWNFTLGAGGINNLGSREYGVLGAELKRQYQHLRNFAEELRQGKITEAQFRSRVQMYVQGARNTFERGRTEAHSKSGYRWEKRKRTKTDSCPECISYEARSWQPINTLPNPGMECRCRARCGCFKEFSKDAAKPANMLQVRWGWTGSLKHKFKAC